MSRIAREKTGSVSRPPRGAGQRRGKRRGRSTSPHPVETRRKAVQLHLEEGIPLEVVSEELGVTGTTLRKWVERYQQAGDTGLATRQAQAGKRKPQLPAAVHQAIVDVKQEHPTFGVRKIAQWLRRTLFLPGSAETVRQTLHRHKAMPVAARRKIRRNPPKPRFFERATPNQMWQSDIFTFRVNGQACYLIGFIDDHSRYITGLGVCRSQTAENVMEVYRRAVGEHGIPKEMLTDNGKQYAAWKGKTRFQKELAKDRIHHIRSAPHHPMTLGKIERFWKTIWEEFLERARFESFENAQERIAYWVKYYNHQRPHQGIDGLCPADRYFSLQKEVRAVVERGVEANVKELALRGKPQTPFYMVGRVGEQNVVLQADRGQVRILVDGQEASGGRDGHSGEAEAGSPGVQRPGEVPGGAGVMDGAAKALGDLPGTGHPLEPAERLAGTGDGGYTAGAGAAEPPAGGTRADAAAAHGEAAGAQGRAADQPSRPVGREGQAGTGEAGAVTVAPAAERSDHAREPATDDAGHPATVGREPDGDAGRPAVGDLPQDVLPVGNPGVAGHAERAVSGPGRTAPLDAGRPAGADAGAEPAAPATGAGVGTTVARVENDGRG